MKNSTQSGCCRDKLHRRGLLLRKPNLKNPILIGIHVTSRFRGTQHYRLLLITLGFLSAVILSSNRAVGQFCAGDPVPQDQVDLRGNPEYTPGQCPANDIQILGASLDIGDACNACEPGTVVTADLLITINHNTNSSNRFLGVFADLTETVNGSATVCDIARCSGPVAKSSDQINSQQTLNFGQITFTCGSVIDLSNILLVWTAANGSCPVTPANNPNGKYCFDNPVIVVTPPLNAIATADCASDFTTNIDLTVSGGSGNFSYLWSNGSVTEDLASVPLGTYSVTVTDNDSDDGTGNPCTVTESITFNGPCCEPPVITCPADVTVECGQSTDPVSTGIATYIEGCGTVTVTPSDMEVPGCGNTKVISRTWTVTDEIGQVAQCVQTITIVDTTPPDITCAADVTIECDESSDPSNTGSATATDNCDNSVVPTFSDNIIPGACPQEKTIERTWTATDDCGNFSSCVQIITIVDTTPPDITCAADVTIECDEDSDPSNTGSATATDNCDNSVVPTFSDNIILGACPQEKTIQRTWTAIDDCGNTSSCTQTITIVDTTPPVIACAPDLIIECDESSDPSNTGSATATDNCDNSVVPTFSDNIIPGACPQEKTIQRTWTAIDDCGNTSSCIQTITVVDTTPPVIACAPDVTIECDESSDPSNAGSATATDNCDNSVVPTFSDNIIPGACPQEKKIERTWTAIDDCGNTSSCIQTITVVDTTPPVIACAPDLIIECDESSDPSNTGLATATDNCDNSVVPTFSDNIIPGACPQEKTIQRTWTAIDDCGNTSSCIQTITIVDTTPPVIACAPDVTIECDESSDPSNTGLATATDNCDNSVVPTFSDNIIPGDCPQEKKIERTWTATDDCGNTSSCLQIINVVDTEPPTIQAPADVTLESCNASTLPVDTGDKVDVNVADNCSAEVTILDPEDQVAPGVCAGTSVITRTWTAVDECGNTSKAIQKITVTDTEAPILAGCPANVTVECDAIPTKAQVTATDDCDPSPSVGFTETTTPGDCFGRSTIVRTWTATDDCGNSSSCEQVITVVDTTPPVITGSPDKTALCGVLNFDFPTATDNCSGVTVQEVSTVDGRDVCGNGPVTRTWKATDACGNSSTHSQTITTNDCGTMELVKLTDGVPNANQSWSFTLYEGPDGFGGSQIASDNTLGDGDGILFQNLGSLSASQTYTICELGVPAGWTSTWEIDTDGDGIGDIPIMPYNPNADDPEPADIGNRCVDFGAGTPYPLPDDAAINCTLIFRVNNTSPGGDQRTPGYWKNWNRCSNGNQQYTAEKNGGVEAGFYLLEDVLGNGIEWCPATGNGNGGGFSITTCELAVAILDSRDFATGRKRASDAAYTLARALLAAQLNFGAGAGTCAEATQAAVQAQDLLCDIGFDGTGRYLRPKDDEYAQALALAGTLDAYNNGLLCDNTQARVSNPTIEVVSPETGVMLNAYPNPFVSTATIDFSVPQAGEVRLEVYNLTGVLVERLFDGEAEAGVVYHNTFDATGKAKGIYLYRLITEDKVHIGRLMTTD